MYGGDYSQLMPHQKRKSHPYYGRRRRHAPAPAWTILDPVTGREIQL